MGKETQSRYISIPLEILGITGNVTDAAIWGYIEGWERSKRTSKIRMHAGVAEIATLFGVSHVTVRASLKRLVALDLISYKRYDRGVLITTNRDVIKAWSKAKVIPQNAASEGEVIERIFASDGGVIERNFLSQRSKESLHHDRKNLSRSFKSNPSLSPSSKSLENDNPKDNPPTEPSITENKSTQAGAGHAGRAGGRSVGLVSDSSEQRTVTLLNPNGYQPKSKPKAATLSKAQADLCCQFLGATGEEAKLPTLVTQEQADKPGFIESCLRIAIDAAAAGKVKGRRVAYLAGILANHWDDGKWEVQMSEADAKELVSIENDRWLLNLTAPSVYEKDRDEYVAKRTAKLDERERKVMAKYGK
jgi:hypothetical protein